MSTSDLLAGGPNALQDAAKNHLWMYFTRHGNLPPKMFP